LIINNNSNNNNVFPVHAIKACRGSRVIAPLILNLGARWGVSDELRVPAALTQG
jgi:hypothetical protein